MIKHDKGSYAGELEFSRLEERLPVLKLPFSYCDLDLLEPDSTRETSEFERKMRRTSQFGRKMQR
jgi:hypothetical protein